MTNDEKLAAILAAVQTDPGNRGLARDSDDNLFTATKGDFEAACRSIASLARETVLSLTTGFYIPTSSPPAFETDGPLGCAFLMRALAPLHIPSGTGAPAACVNAITKALWALTGTPVRVVAEADDNGLEPEHTTSYVATNIPTTGVHTHLIAIEHVGRATDGRYYSMRGRDISQYASGGDEDYLARRSLIGGDVTIGIGDGGNEIGMGKIPHETIVKNIPNGDLIHCRVPTDHLVVAGVSNWVAYALAAGVYVLRGVKPPSDLFDPERERAILELMVREGPLVDGVTGQQTATVDGLTWDEYAKPLVRIREILES